jgi:hypothetical protein
MTMVVDFRPADSPLIQTIWRARSEHAGGFVSIAASHWELVVVRPAGAAPTIVLRGPETRATPLTYPADVAWCGIRFRIGALLPRLPAAALVDRALDLPVAGNQAFRLHGAAWPLPTFEDADAFIDRLVRNGLLVFDPVVAAAAAGVRPNLSARSVERRFRQVTGLTQGTVRQIDRARRAMDLLQRGTPILDVVHEAGYYDQPHLTRSLKRWLGRTPLEIAGARPVAEPSF